MRLLWGILIFMHIDWYDRMRGGGWRSYFQCWKYIVCDPWPWIRIPRKHSVWKQTSFTRVNTRLTDLYWSVSISENGWIAKRYWLFSPFSFQPFFRLLFFCYQFDYTTTTSWCGEKESSVFLRPACLKHDISPSRRWCFCAYSTVNGLL